VQGMDVTAVILSAAPVTAVVPGVVVVPHVSRFADAAGLLVLRLAARALFKERYGNPGI